LTFEVAVSIARGGQIKAARALIGWSRHDLAIAAGLHVNAVAWWETKDVIPIGTYAEPVACRRIREALRMAGVVFLINPSPGVRICEKNTIKRRVPARARAPASWTLTPTGNAPDKTQRITHDQVEPPRQISPPASGRCGAKTRSGGTCRRKGISPGNRCANHGGLSTGPKSEKGRRRIAMAQKRRWAAYRKSRSE
jgi:transcriptional regulator with XRE-family HTH domain